MGLDRAFWEDAAQRCGAGQQGQPEDVHVLSLPWVARGYRPWPGCVGLAGRVDALRGYESDLLEGMGAAQFLVGSRERGEVSR